MRTHPAGVQAKGHEGLLPREVSRPKGEAQEAPSTIPVGTPLKKREKKENKFSKRKKVSSPAGLFAFLAFMDSSQGFGLKSQDANASGRGSSKRP